MYNNGYYELYHYGVKGQKHGERKYQNPDGSLTPEGYIHYGYGKNRTPHRSAVYTNSTPNGSGSRYLNSNGTLNDRAKKRYQRMLLLNKATNITSPLGLLKKENRDILRTSGKDFGKSLSKTDSKQAAEYLENQNKKIKRVAGIGAGVALASAGLMAYRMSGSDAIGRAMSNSNVGRRLLSFSYSPVARKTSTLTRRYGKKVAAAGATAYIMGSNGKQIKKIASGNSNNTKKKK